VIVVGPGASAGVEEELDAAQSQKLLETSALFLAKDFVVPVFLQFVVPRMGFGDSAGVEIVDALAGDVAKLVLQQIPQAVTLVSQGDVRGAVAVAWDAIAGSSTLRDAVLDIIIERMYDYRTEALAKGTDRATSLASGFAKTTGAVDAMFAAGDATYLFQSVLNSNRADGWTVDVTSANVRFDPPEAEVYPESSVRLDVRVIDAGEDAVFEYVFSTNGVLGELSDELHRGDVVTSSQPWIRYDAGEDEGTEVVLVEVYEVP